MTGHDTYKKFMLADAIRNFDPGFIVNDIDRYVYILNGSTDAINKAMVNICDFIKYYITETDKGGYAWISDRLCNEDDTKLLQIYYICSSIRFTYNILGEAAKDAISYKKYGTYPYNEDNIRNLSEDQAIILYEAIAAGNR